MQLIKFKTNLNLYYFTNLINIFFSFVVTALLSNSLTPKDFGFFSFAQNIFFVLYAISFSNYYSSNACFSKTFERRLHLPTETEVARGGEGCGACLVG